MFVEMLHCLSLPARIFDGAEPMRVPKNESGGTAYSVPAIHRTLDIIETLVEKRTLTVSELHRQFKIPKSSAYAILQTLKSRGYVDKDELDQYSLSLRSEERRVGKEC